MGINPKNPQTLHHPRPQNIPIILLGIFGDETPKNPEIELIPTPKSPQILFKLYPRPRPIPEIWGRDGENRESGPCFTTLYLTST